MGLMADVVFKKREGSLVISADRWLRWTDLAGNLISTGAELAYLEQQRADAEQARADAEQGRADAEQQRADTEAMRANSERERAEQLIEQLRRLGIEPEGFTQ